MAVQTIRIELDPIPVLVDMSQEPVTVTITGAIVQGLDVFVTRKAATGAISALRVVCTDSASDLQYCDGDDAGHSGHALGVSLTAVGAGGGIVNVVTAGRMADALWSWTPGLPVYCGADGVLTQDPEAPDAFVQQVAVADSATSIVVGIRMAVVKG